MASSALAAWSRPWAASFLPVSGVTATPGARPVVASNARGALFVHAGVVAWRVLDPILSIYRRGGLSVVSGLATVLAMLLCIPVHQLAGRAGLGALGVGALLLSLLLARLVRAAEAV